MIEVRKERERERERERGRICELYGSLVRNVCESGC